MITPVLPTYARAPLRFARGEGSWLYTEQGDAYLDFASGVAVNALGHCHPRVVAALKDQADKLWHVSNLYQITGQEDLAALLIKNTFADTVFFANSGAEAMECSIKMARKHFAAKGEPQRNQIITFEGAFHGRTLATIAAGGQRKYMEGFGPDMPGFVQVPFGDHEALKKAITPETAAILIEPVQGEGGVRDVPAQCLRGLRELCDAEGILLIFDEVQCGMGRTGALFDHQLAGITPDIMGVAKGLGAGFPVGACLATENAALGMTAGTHGSTFGGNPLAMAVGKTVLTIVTEDGFLEGVKARSLVLRQRLAELKDTYPQLIEAVRGRGLLLGLKLKIAPAEFVQEARNHHLLTVPAGDNVVRLLPPLNVSEEDMAKAITALEASCRALMAAKKS